MAQAEGFVHFRQNIQNTLTLHWQNNKKNIEYEQENYSIKMARRDAPFRDGNGDAHHGMGTNDVHGVRYRDGYADVQVWQQQTREYRYPKGVRCTDRRSCCH